MSIYFQIAIFVILFVSPIFGCGKSGGGCGGQSTINAAVISKHYFKVKDVASSSQDIDIPTIVINSGSSPLKIQMESTSSDIEIEQKHQGSKPQKKISSSIDGAIILNHFVKKPIIQKIHHLLVPTRKIVQEVLPVREVIKTIIAQSPTTSAPDTTPKYVYYYKKMPPPPPPAPTTTAAPTSTEGDTSTAGYMDYFF